MYLIHIYTLSFSDTFTVNGIPLRKMDKTVDNGVIHIIDDILRK